MTAPSSNKLVLFPTLLQLSAVKSINEFIDTLRADGYLWTAEAFFEIDTEIKVWVIKDQRQKFVGIVIDSVPVTSSDGSIHKYIKFDLDPSDFGVGSKKGLYYRECCARPNAGLSRRVVLPLAPLVPESGGAG